MQDLKPLIRMHKLRADDQRRVIAELRAAHERLLARRTALEEELVRERQAAAASLEAAVTFQAYLKQLGLRRDQLETQIRSMAAQLAQAEDALTAMFQELKRFELAQEERDRLKKQARTRRENQMFDEIASVRHQRKGLEE